jgi:cytochrome b
MTDMQRILVWDLPVRLGHWLMAIGFALAWVTGDSEEWRLVHIFAGGTVTAIALFRLLWGIVGSKYARFTDFVRGPQPVFRYLKSLLSASPQHSVGHNPAGGWAILALLILALATGASGWLAYQEMGGEWMGELHEGVASVMLAVVLVHLAGVMLGSLVHRENLVWAMLTGRKQGNAGDAISGVRPLAAMLLLGWAAAGTWWLAR